MPAKPQDKTRIVCPHCGGEQMEPRLAISTNCRQCGRHLVIQEILHPKHKTVERVVERKRVACFDCNTEMEVPTAAKSAMCKRCSSYIDLQDYTINNAVSKNFKTKGDFVVEAKGYLFNTTVTARDIVVRGRIIGKIVAERSLTVYSTAEIKGATFRTPLLIVPAENCFRWKDLLRVSSVEIIGELVGNVCADVSVILRATGRLFGNVQARNLVVEEGAVLVGQASVGTAAIG
jgi:cytoskeletal protein CcmA (bactofilin family)/DNA-directed RNA polymerase subunit RPC12/RpoP